MTAKALLQSAGDGTAIPASYIGQIISSGPTTTTLTANGTFTTIATLTNIPVGVWLVTSGGYSASGGGTHYIATARWLVKGTADTTDGKSVIYGTDDGTGERISSQMTPYYLTVVSGDATKEIAVQIAMTETGSPSRNWVQYIQAIRIA